MSELVLLVATWICWIGYKDRNVGLLALQLLLLFSLFDISSKFTPSPSLFIRYYFGRYSPGIAKLVLIPYSCERLTCYSDRLCDFSVWFLGCVTFLIVISFLSAIWLPLIFNHFWGNNLTHLMFNISVNTSLTRNSPGAL